MDAAVEGEIRELREAIDRLSYRAQEPADDRKYRYSRSNNELGYRLVLGEDPARVPDDQLEEVSPLSPRTIRSLLSDGDCPLYRVKVGGSAFVPEAAVRQYERFIADGAPSYMNPTPR